MGTSPHGRAIVPPPTPSFIRSNVAPGLPSYPEKFAHYSTVRLSMPTLLRATPSKSMMRTFTAFRHICCCSFFEPNLSFSHTQPFGTVSDHTSLGCAVFKAPSCVASAIPRALLLLTSGTAVVLYKSGAGGAVLTRGAKCTLSRVLKHRADPLVPRWNLADGIVMTQPRGLAGFQMALPPPSISQGVTRCALCDNYPW